MKCTMLLCRMVLLSNKIIAVQERLLERYSSWYWLESASIYIFVSQLLTLLSMKILCLCLKSSLFVLFYKICLSVVFIHGKCILLKPPHILDRLWFYLPLSYEVFVHVCTFYAREVDKFEHTKLVVRRRKSKKDRQNNS